MDHRSDILGRLKDKRKSSKGQHRAAMWWLTNDAIKEIEELRSGQRVTLDHDHYFNGIRFDAGDYVIRRVGPPSPPAEF